MDKAQGHRFHSAKEMLKGGPVRAFFISILMFSAPVYAEPGAGTAHHLPLRVLALAICLIAGTLPWVLKTYLLKEGLSHRQLWLLSLALVFFALIFVAPGVIAIGSILWTGRTM